MNKHFHKHTHLPLLCLLLLLSICPAHMVNADSKLAPTAYNNLASHLKKSSGLVAVSDGYMRVYYDNTKVCIEYYDDSFTLKSKRSLSMELKLWGGFYASANAYYLVEGQSNTEESDTAEVIRVIKYDLNWSRLGAAVITGNTELFGGEVRYPFDYGCVEFAENNGFLYIVTAHEGYVDPQYKQGHQGFLMIKVDPVTMTGKIVKSDLWHSFAQYIKSSDTDLYVLEQSEGSRYTKLSKYDSETLKGTSIPVLEYGGNRTSAWAINCYASVDGMELSSDSALCIGTSIDQSQYDNVTSKTPHNIYLTVTPMSDFSKESTVIHWLTSYTNGGKSFLGVKITKINPDRFMISWEEADTEGTASIEDSLTGYTLHYLFVDGHGNKISQEFQQAMPISECQPILKNSKIVYYASNENTVNFYSINSDNGSVQKKTYRVAGENATWDLQNGVLTISGSGPIYIDHEVHHRSSLSSASSWTSYSSYDNVWKTIRDQVRKIVIKGGITSIPEQTFSGFNNLTEVIIEDGVQSIGKQAFYNNDSLRKITIPSSVTRIEEDILWTGSYWTYNRSHVFRATIYAPYKAYAIRYAKANKILYRIGLVSDKTKITGIKKSYTYTGKKLTPKPSVKLGNQTLRPGIDYTVTYKNNKNPGTATITITGSDSYYGTLTKTFTITKQGEKPDDSKPSGNTALKVGTKKTINNLTYQITKPVNGKRTVTLIKVKNKNQTKYKIPNTVKIGSYRYQVTAIGSKAFNNCKTARQIILPKTITRIYPKAFKGTTKKLTISIPKNRYSKLYPQLKKSGIHKKAKTIKR